LRRLGALVYDLLVVAGVVMLSSFLLIAARGGAAVQPGAAWFQTLVVLQLAGYFIYFWTRGGQTPGMRTWRIRVERLYGGRLSAAQAGWRLLAGIATGALLGAAILWALASKNGQGLHDLAARTRVVRVN
jgi:uncharacterized RDD family membrane protein YckC